MKIEKTLLREHMEKTCKDLWKGYEQVAQEYEHCFRGKWVSQIFNYLNGKINKNRAATIEIVNEPSRADIGWSGASIVYINYIRIKLLMNTTYGISNILYNHQSCVKNQTLKLMNMVFDVIAHELSHMDQAIDDKRYNSDKEYKNCIENANMFRSYKWIVDNFGSLKKEFPYLDFEYFNDKLNNVVSNIPFNFENPKEHIVKIIDRYFQLFINDASLVPYLSYDIDKCTWGDLIIGTKRYPLSDQKECLNVINGVINSFLYKYNGKKIPAIIYKYTDSNILDIVVMLPKDLS